MRGGDEDGRTEMVSVGCRGVCYLLFQGDCQPPRPEDAFTSAHNEQAAVIRQTGDGGGATQYSQQWCVCVCVCIGRAELASVTMKSVSLVQQLQMVCKIYSTKRFIKVEEKRKWEITEKS